VARARPERKTHRHNKCQKERKTNFARAAPRAEQTHRTTAVMSAFTAHTKATTHPIIVHPRKKLSKTIPAMSRLLRAIAISDGKKYIAKLSPRKGKKKNAGKRFVINTT
jgi:hypothetical protein